MEEKTFFERKIKPLLMYVGTLGAILMSIAYVITVIVLIYGFKANSTLNLTIFAIVNAIVGLVIMFFLKVQGIDFAKNEPKTKKIIEQYYGTTTKDKKNRSIKFFWITSSIKDILTKGLTLGISSAGVIYLVIAGNGDTKLILLAVVNLIMFICFGFLSLVNAYDFYKERHVKYMLDELEKVNVKTEAKEGDQYGTQIWWQNI